jgi:hypothetical protein
VFGAPVNWPELTSKVQHSQKIHAQQNNFYYHTPRAVRNFLRRKKENFPPGRSSRVPSIT